MSEKARTEERLNGKVAKDHEEALSIQETYENKPSGWIQWKGTDACMDIRCKCGHLSHVDAEFAYFIQCPACRTVFMCNGHIELIEVKNPPEDEAITAR